MLNDEDDDEKQKEAAPSYVAKNVGSVKACMFNSNTKILKFDGLNRNGTPFFMYGSNRNALFLSLRKEARIFRHNGYNSVVLSRPFITTKCMYKL